MPASISWISPGRILRIKLEGDITESDLAQLRPQVKQALEKVSFRIDYVMDLSKITSFAPAGLRVILNKNALLRSPKTGRIAVIGAGAAERLVLDSASTVLRIPIGYADNERDALTFIVEA